MDDTCYVFQLSTECAFKLFANFVLFIHIQFAHVVCYTYGMGAKAAVFQSYIQKKKKINQSLFIEQLGYKQRYLKPSMCLCQPGLCSGFSEIVVMCFCSEHFCLTNSYLHCSVNARVSDMHDALLVVHHVFVRCHFSHIHIILFPYCVSLNHALGDCTCLQSHFSCSYE